MAEGRNINLYKGAQYIEHADSVVNNYYYSDNAEVGNAEVKELIDGLYELKDDRGERVFKDQDQWFAVYKVLSMMDSIPSSMSDFAKYINENKLAEEKPKCVYNSIKRASASLPLFAGTPSKWERNKDSSEQYKKQYAVASFLMESLKNM